MTISEYFSGFESAVLSNPPTRQSSYEDDPIAVWKYYMRGFGHGLAEFSDKDANSVIGKLYSLFMRCVFMHKIPNINSKDIVMWVTEARNEILNKERK